MWEKSTWIQVWIPLRQDPCKQQKSQGKRKDWKNMWQSMAGYSFRLAENMCLMGMFAVSKEDTSDRFSLASLSRCLPPSWRKVLIEANKATNMTGRLQFLPEIFFPVEKLIYSSLYFRTLTFSKLAWKWLQQLLERRSREMAVWDIVPKCPGGSPLQDWDAASETHLLFLWMLPERAIPPRS